MSTRIGANTRSRTGLDSATGVPRRVIGSYATYAEAEEAVDYLTDRGFPVERIAIVGRGLQYVERITGRIGYLDAALRGALVGGITGALIGWLFGVFGWFDPVVATFWLTVDGLWFGVLVGLLIGLLAYALGGGRRDFASIPAMVAERYEVIADEDVADEAARLLAARHEPVAANAAAGDGTPAT